MHKFYIAIASPLNLGTGSYSHTRMRTTVSAETLKLRLSLVGLSGRPAGPLTKMTVV